MIAFSACQKPEYNPKMVRFFKRGNEALKQEDYRKAITLYQQAGQYDSSLADLYNNLGIAYFYLDEFPEALQSYEKALMLDSSFSDALLNRANLYVSQNTWKKALPDLDQLIRQEPDTSRYYFLRARVYLNLKNYEASQADLNRLLEMEPQNALALDSRGYVNMQLGQWKAAEKDLQEAIRLEPQQDLAWANLGRLQIQLNQFPLAMASLHKALALRADEPYTLNIRAFAYLWQDSTQAAYADIQNVLKQDPENPEGLRNLGIYHLEKGSNEEALPPLKKSLALAPSSWTAYYLGKLYQADGPSQSQVCDYWQQVSPQDTLLFGQEFLKCVGKVKEL